MSTDSTPEQYSRGDRDLLIRNCTMLESLTQEIRGYNCNTSNSISDHEKRIREIEEFKQQSIGSTKNMKISILIIGSCCGILSVIIGLSAFIFK